MSLESSLRAMSPMTYTVRRSQPQAWDAWRRLMPSAIWQVWKRWRKRRNRAKGRQSPNGLGQTSDFPRCGGSGNFTHAGEALSISQSAVSRHISALERDLNVPLFTGTRAGWFYRAGRLLYRTAQEVFSKLATTQISLRIRAKPAGSSRSQRRGRSEPVGSPRSSRTS